VSEAEGALFGDCKKIESLQEPSTGRGCLLFACGCTPKTVAVQCPGLSNPAKWPLGTGAVLVKTAFKMSGQLKIEDKSQECSSLAFGGSARRGGPSRTRQRAKVWAATSSAVSAAVMLKTSCLCDSDKLQRGWARPAPIGSWPFRPIRGFLIQVNHLRLSGGSTLGLDLAPAALLQPGPFLRNRQSAGQFGLSSKWRSGVP